MTTELAVVEGGVPEGPVDLEEVVRRFPMLRQSRLATFDDCALSALFDLQYGSGWSTHPQARGTLFHRFAAECLRTMKGQESGTIPVGEALAILVEVAYQRDVAPEEIVRVPLREMKDLRMAATKFAKDNAFTIGRLLAVERRLSATLRYPDEDGAVVERTLTGAPDALLHDPARDDGLVVLDWKDTWGLPPEPRDAPSAGRDELRGLSYHGYFQQRYYGWLVLKNLPSINYVTLREFYVRKTQVRAATLSRDALPEIEEELAVLAHDFDAAVAQGLPQPPYRLGTLDRWKPSPGKHCGYCARPGLCPIEDEARGVGAITSQEMAVRYAAEMVTAEAVRESRREALKAWVEARAPVPVKWSKGRRVLGWYRTKGGRRFGFYTPDASDRGGHARDSQLEDAMRSATERAREERDRRRGRRRVPA